MLFEQAICNIQCVREHKKLCPTKSCLFMKPWVVSDGWSDAENELSPVCYHYTTHAHRVD